MPSPPVAPSPAISEDDGVSGFAVGSSSPRSQPVSTSSIGGAVDGVFARAGSLAAAD